MGFGIYKYNSPQGFGIIERITNPIKPLNLSNATWGNIVTGDDAEVLLNYPANDYITLLNDVEFNCSANITGGVALTNISLWHNGTGTWKLNQTTDLIRDNYHVLRTITTLDSGGHVGTTEKSGVKITMVKPYISVTQITKNPSVTATKGYVLDSAKGVLATANFAGNDATFTTPYELTNGVTYYFAVDSEGGAYVDRYGGSPNITQTEFTVIDTLNNAGLDDGATTNIYSVQKVTVETLSINFTTQTFNTTITDPTLWTCEACDGDGDCGFATENRTVLVDTVPPSITIDSPALIESIGYADENQTLNWTVTDTNFGFGSVWFNYNGTNITLDGSSNETNFILESGNTNLTFYANDSVGNVNETVWEWTYTLFINSEAYVSSTVEGATNSFTTNITYDSSKWNVISGNLWYNHTEYPGTKTGTGNEAIFTSNVAAPNLDAPTNVSFNWRIGTTNSTDTYYANLTSNNQTVSIINMSLCGYPYTVPYLNFTLYNEATLAELNGSISLTFDYRQTNATIVNEFNFEDTNNNQSKFNFCIDPSDQIYKIDSVLEYYATGYTHKFYNFEGIDFTNTTTEIGLYLLNESSSTSFVIEVKDSSYQPLVGVEVYIPRYDVGTGTWFTSEIAVTDSDGETIQHIYTEDALYRFKIYRSGTLLYTSPSKIIACPTTPCTVTIIVSEAFTNPLNTFTPLGDLTSSLTYDKSTYIVTYTYSDTSGEFTQGRLLVKQSTPGLSGIVAACNTTSSSSSAVLTCDLSAETNGTYVATGYITRGTTEQMVERKVFNKIRSIVAGIGVDGVLWSIFFLIGILMLGVYRPSLGIIFGIVGVLMLWMLQLMEISITAIVALVGIAVILLLEVRKE